MILECGYRVDLVVENQVIVEVKAVSMLALIPFPRNNFIKSTALFGLNDIFNLANLDKLAAISKCHFASKIRSCFYEIIFQKWYNS